ncbi:MAG: hypothetical protein ACKOBG_04610 [Actinomycetota bacterium]
MTVRRSERGAVVVEWAAAVACLLLPMVVVATTVPQWAERRHAATVAARESARVLVRDWPRGDPVEAVAVAWEVAELHGIDRDEVTIRAPLLAPGRGDRLAVSVEVPMPAIAVLGMRVGSWRYRALEVRRVEDFRSR